MAPPLPPRHASRPRADAGFSLLELIVVMSILAILAGAAIPVVSKSLTRSRINDTKARLARLESAIVKYFEDTGQFPPTFGDLEENASKAAGWTGPYLRNLTAGNTGPDASLDKDAWGNAYLVETDGDSALIIISKGPDGLGNGLPPGGSGGGKGKGKGKGDDWEDGDDKDNGKGNDKGGKGDDDDDDDGGKSGGGGWSGSDKPEDADNLVVEVDVTPVRRQLSLGEMKVLNTAISQWNAANLPDKPLNTKLSKLLDQLSKGGYLPNDTDEWEEDGWGDAYKPSPSGGPVMKVTSKNVQ